MTIFLPPDRRPYGPEARGSLRCLVVVPKNSRFDKLIGDYQVFRGVPACLG
jgi:hypothetical protein